MQGKQHSTERKQADIPSAQHLITQTGLQQGIEHKPAVAHAYQRVSSGQQRTTSPADMLTLQRSIGNQAVQRLVTRTTQGGTELAQRKENRTGLPDRLKAGAERLSGVSLDDVNVHYNSSQPAQLQALAYTQGTDIHVGPGQERHLAHEAWHVVQQKQGRVLPTLQASGVAINDDEGLEREADAQGARAIQGEPLSPGEVSPLQSSKSDVIQRNGTKRPAATPTDEPRKSKRAKRPPKETWFNEMDRYFSDPHYTGVPGNPDAGGKYSTVELG